MNKVIAIGPLPPPVHGNSKNFQLACYDLSKVADVKIINTSPGGLRRNYTYHARKFFRCLYGLILLIFWRFRFGIDSVYMTPDAGMGMIYSFIFLRLLKLLGVGDFYLHHRSFAYVDKYSGQMNMIVGFLGVGAHHIFLCECMCEAFKCQYGEVSSGVVSNSHYVSENEPSGEYSESRIRLGFMSNVSKEKGIDDAVMVLRTLLQNGFDVTLKVGGVADSEEAMLFLMDAKREFGDRLILIGYVAHSEKINFYSDVDIFLFPSKYKNEAQPNVVFEAFSFGCVVISTDIGCTASDVIVNGGFIVPQGENFHLSAVKLVVESHKKIKENQFSKRDSSYCMLERAKNARYLYDDMIRRVAGLTGRS